MRALAAAGVLLTGCFYVDPIIERPSVRICVQSADTLHRGGTVTLEARFGTTCDAASTGGTYDWKVYACATYEPSAATGCDQQPFFPPATAELPSATFQVPVKTADRGELTQAIQVRLEARNDRGSLAQGGLIGFQITDGAPEVDLGISARTYTVGAPIDLLARYQDADNALDDIALDWAPVPPVTPGAFTLEDLAVPPSVDPADATSRTVAKRLTPGEPGDWAVDVTAHYVPGVDRPDTTVRKHLGFTIHPDRPPCLAQWQPIAPPGGATLPVTAPTVFQVPLVDDDLDPYPAVAGVPGLGTTTFAWSILPPGASPRRILVSGTANHIDFDPSAFRPGDIVELRVEIFDRLRTPLPCSDSAPTCSIASSASCLQRQTWRVEVR